MKTLHLYGSLADQFGDTFRMDVRTVAEAIRLMECNFRGRFVAAIKDKWFKVRYGETELLSDDLVNVGTSSDDIHIEPIVAGGIKGIFGLFFGFNLLGSVFAPLGFPSLGGAFGAGSGGIFGFAGVGGALGGIGQIGLGLALLGVIYLISSAFAPDENEGNAPEDTPSFVFDGPVNVTEQGGPVFLVYGVMLVGATLIAGGIDIEQLQV